MCILIVVQEHTIQSTCDIVKFSSASNTQFIITVVVCSILVVLLVLVALSICLYCKTRQIERFVRLY